MDDDDRIARQLHERRDPGAKAYPVANSDDAEVQLRRIVRENHPGWDMPVPPPIYTAAELRDLTDARKGEAGFVPDVGDEVIVTAGTIQRSNGAAWKGDRGTVINKNGDGHQVRFGSLILDNIKDNEITNA
ncbi:hypothetical protein [Phytohabitans houttuyneae]|uniref:Uncharacterized protein n=1 Tax=Phytohabitans houttuyneae TaxID=1076126 RepID=A0A6V8K444_9ACTN|nr:hypothetical protein [Phytohabitans houttuyneae]GFJ78310.1 hypothetical protein Phou_024900 [Phytohabitans houttuyneae]